VWSQRSQSRPQQTQTKTQTNTNANTPRVVAPGVYAVKWSDQDRKRTPFSTEWFVLSDELDATALKLGSSSYNQITAADASVVDTLLTGQCVFGCSRV